ncbi:hypothetical protein [Sulfolobus acidocaldarius]|uniref:Uncharacterized protein n=3 Tax=Sulfolobus acidocaldarius TaxID=2285 RepID=Q4J8N1_SULAC|nr:hypothetical protein [Sulfolobus acidocaldarius]AAY80846.1 hypothetical protein Saci_1528 [Sulfolobus acidocaldarius DSM 639]AGE71446.1 hypothetical protein SacN8_07415 [Sulfolobus acidocaldarius N8]AGE73719.1 hypothetical protein SacRon12I_07425 [Sulfolobus acidocaldarius Ron12/I]WCM35357.1 hypothetical protein GO597_08490 [Sulfolobus acidocaldarius DSM 639]
MEREFEVYLNNYDIVKKLCWKVIRESEKGYLTYNELLRRVVELDDTGLVRAKSLAWLKKKVGQLLRDGHLVRFMVRGNWKYVYYTTPKRWREGISSIEGVIRVDYGENKRGKMKWAIKESLKVQAKK